MSDRIPLADLEPCFLKIESENEHRVVDSIGEADGILFCCPKCYLDAGRTPIGVHSVLCWQPHVPPNRDPKPGRWALVGASLADVSLVAGSSSVLLTSGCRAHFFVRNGGIEDLT